MDITEIEEHLNILIVDDSLINIQAVSSILDGEKYDISFATDGREALEILESEKFDLVLLDIMMPEMDGLEVCRAMKKNKATSGIPVIFLTARNDEETISEAFEIGGVDYVTKPFLAAELKKRISNHIKLDRTEKDLRRKNNELVKALKEIEALQGIIPICASCKKIRNDEGFWQQVEEYIEIHSKAEFTHSICEECAEKLYGDEEWFRDREKEK